MHPCSAGNCSEDVPRFMLFCNRHWQMLSWRLKQQLKEFAGIEGFQRRRDYHAVRRAAIADLDAKESQQAMI